MVPRHCDAAGVERVQTGSFAISHTRAKGFLLIRNRVVQGGVSGGGGHEEAEEPKFEADEESDQEEACGEQNVTETQLQTNNVETVQNCKR